MKKTIILTFALIAALATQAQNDFFAYIVDDTPTNVRNAPNGKVVQKLSTEECYVVELISAKNKWWKIDPVVITEGDNPREFSLKGSKTGYWVHSSVLQFTVAGDPEGCLRTAPNWKSKAVRISPSTEMSFHPLECSGQWIKVVTTDGRHTGWMHNSKICFNPLTTCP